MLSEILQSSWFDTVLELYVGSYLLNNVFILFDEIIWRIACPSVDSISTTNICSNSKTIQFEAFPHLFSIFYKRNQFDFILFFSYKYRFIHKWCCWLFRPVSTLPKEALVLFFFECLQCQTTCHSWAAYRFDVNFNTQKRSNIFCINS